MFCFHKYISFLSFCLIIYIVGAVNLSARSSSNNPVAENLPRLKQIGTEMNRHVLAMLTLIKEYERTAPVSNEANRDMRGTSSVEMNALLGQIARHKSSIDGLYESANLILSRIEDHYRGLDEERKNEAEADYTSAMSYREKIEKYYGYASRFFKPYEVIAVTKDTAVPSKVMPGERFKGTASADFGRSTYQAAGTNATYSRKIAFDGTYQVNNRTSANAAFNHQNELMQTQFTSTSVNSGISTKPSENLDLGGTMGYQDYRDKETGSNSYGQLHAGLRIAYDPGERTRFYGNLGMRNKAFRNRADQNYTGVYYSAGIAFIPDHQRNLAFQIRGNSQFSEADYLHFNQINPQIRYTSNKTRDKSFAFTVDMDMIAFGVTNQANDYQKFSTDFLWRKKKEKEIRTRKLYLSSKLHPFNNRQNYGRFNYTVSRRRGSVREKRSSNTTFSTLLNVYLQREELFLTDYMDIRFDQSSTGKRSFFTFNVFNRFWNNFAKTDTTRIDHVTDLYCSVGPYYRSRGAGKVKLGNLKIGVILGGHIAYNLDEQFIVRTGNSLRGGLMASGSIRIYRGSIAFTGSYERSLITANVPVDPVTDDIDLENILWRRPNSVRFKIDYRQPVAKNWDIHFNVSNYHIRTDATIQTSANPIERRSNMRIYGGVVYRFAI